MTAWRDTRPRDYDPGAPDQQLGLFAEPDPLGTLDLFVELEETAPTDPTSPGGSR